MAPKAAAEPQAVSDDRVKVLINRKSSTPISALANGSSLTITVIVTADDFKANLKDMAPLCNIADAKNVYDELPSPDFSWCIG